MPDRRSASFVASERDRTCPFDPSPDLLRMRDEGGPRRLCVFHPVRGEIEAVVLTRYSDVRAAFVAHAQEVRRRVERAGPVPLGGYEGR
jgi:hypothetical protein